jgi:site-specific DNA recombinase
VAVSAVRAAIYLRVSLDREMDGLAIDRQRDDCLRITADRGWIVVGTYVDQSRSATDKTKRRPDYDRMVADYLTGSFDAIICWDLDRLTRQPRQLEEWIDAAEARGLRLVTANGEADLTTDGGRMYARVKAAVARGEVERSAARRSAAELQRARRGRAPKGTRLLGYSTSGDVIEEEAAAVRELFRLCALCDGPSMASMAAALSGESGEGAVTTLPRLPKRSRVLAIERNEKRLAAGLEPADVPDDGPWALSTVLGVLRNPRYAGYSVYAGGAGRAGARTSSSDWIVRDEDGNPIWGEWEPLVDEDTWNAVQERLDHQSIAARPEPAVRYRYLGSGIYRCGHCGRPVTAKSGRYRCAGTPGSTRGHFTRSSNHIDDSVLRVVHQMLVRPDLEELLLSPDAPRAAEIRGEIAQRRRRVERALRDLELGDVHGADVARIRSREASGIAELEEERRRVLGAAGLGSLIDCRDPRAVFDEADVGFQRRVVESLVEVRVLRQPSGRRGVDPATVRVVPRAERL